MLSRFLVTLCLLATAPRFFVVTLALGAWPGRFPSGSHKTRRSPAAGLLSSLRSKLPYAPALALLYTQFALLELLP